MMLFFIQLLSDYIEFTYILCLMTLSINENILTVLFFFSPIFLMFLKKRASNKFILLMGILMILSRVMETLFFDTQLRMITSGFGVGCFMIFFSAFLISEKQLQEKQREVKFGLGLALALLLSVFFRTLNSTVDISTYSWFQVIGWILAILAIGLLFEWYQNQEKLLNSSETSDATESSTNFNKKRLLNLTCGILSIFFLINFAFTSPGVISRWTEGNYFLIIMLIVTVLVVTSLVLLQSPELISRISPLFLWIWNALFILSLVITLLVNQVNFPTDPGYFPIQSPPTTIFHHLLVILLILLLPIIIIDFILLSREFMNLTPKPSSRSLGGCFTIGSGLYLLGMIFAILFTSTWGFIPFIGTLFRDLFWFIFFLVGIVLVFSLSSLKNQSLRFSKSNLTSKTKLITSSLLVLVFLGSFVSIIVLEPHPTTQSENPTSLKILNYNLQQGVNEKANKNYDGQLNLIKEINADVIGIQECSKLAGSSDIVRYFADKLNMFSYFGPKWITGTTGVAVLSKYPIKNATTLYHFNENVDRKQTATTECQIEVGTHTYTIYVTHAYGRMSTRGILQTDIVNRINGKSDVIFLGDFNFKPFTEPYNLTTQVLNDSWWVRWPTGVDNLGYSNNQDIELIFVSSDISISDCQFVIDPQSDHPAYWVTIQL
jgi:endonuclease/exonuclease/phosphatase family metal-dependent hydrolase